MKVDKTMAGRVVRPEGSWLRKLAMLGMSMLFLGALAGTAVSQKFEGLASTPPMGWNTWNYFGCDFDEHLIREIADAMVSTGMRDAGYVYLNLDNCWQLETRDPEGRLKADPSRFPSGMRAIGDYLHARGLKFGIYSDAGPFTCGGFWPGSAGREYEDALTFAEWGVDYLKYDWCYSDGLDAETAYGKMAQALVSAERPVVFSICEWGINEPWNWAGSKGHLWRTTGDITNCFDCVIDHGDFYTWGALQIMDQQAELRKHHGPGGWNDPDMLEVGNGMTEAEDRAHFSMWSMMAAPLIAGNDIRNMSEATRAILTNSEVIAVDQDPLGIQGFRYADRDSLEIWFKPLSAGDWAMTILNRSSVSRVAEFDWSSERVVDNLVHRDVAFDDVTYRVRDLWKKEDIGTTGKLLIADIATHDVLMVRLTPVNLSGGTMPSGSDFRLFPNPAASATTIQMRADEPGRVVITILDHLGRLVSRPVEKEVTIGIYSFDLSLDGLSSGTYYVRSSGARGSVVKALSVVR